MWDKLRSLRPSLVRHIEIQPRLYQGQQAYVLHDKAKARFHKLDPAAYEMLEAMDGHKTLAQLLAVARHRLEAQGHQPLPEQADALALLQYLYVADLLICDLPADVNALFQRRTDSRKRRWLQRLANPITWRISFGSPDPWLSRLQWLARILASRTMGLLWLGIVGWALIQAFVHWEELSSTSLEVLLSPSNLLLLWLTYPALKIVHELGHGLFTKVWGGEIYDCGVVFILGVPLPYMDATAASGFAQKHRRLMVGAAGMAVELFLAAVALLLWLAVEPGLIQKLLYNVVLLGSISTLLFNGNPLLKFDGYHLLCDALETPNLAARAKSQLAYLLNRYGLGLASTRAVAHNRRGALALTLYGLLALGYRWLIFAVIFYLIAGYSLALALVLAVWMLFFQLLLPASKSLRQSFSQLKGQRSRAISFLIAAPAMLLVVLFVLPLPLATEANGVVWLPEDSRALATAPGFVETLEATHGQTAAVGQPLAVLRNEELKHERQIAALDLEKFKLQYQQSWAQNRSEAGIVSEQIRALQSELEHLDRQLTSLTLTSPSAGRVYFADHHELVGQYLREGDILAYVVPAKARKIRVALTQQQIGLVREATRDIEIKLAGVLSQTYHGRISSEVPGGTFTLPSAVLGSLGGGNLAVSLKDESGTTTEQMVFLVDVILDEPLTDQHYGQRAYLQFHHAPEPLAFRWWRALRQLFISQLDH
ncbi:HlyD family efflux transporter periplasmic adaptor subunit [Gilvimarinus algae]|uniref:HlyD family efflux transporter periplasmic adaptor subunit n=1 Tax=Gilvimarinus algae TaxID=3058037 RepID=A0ABT8TBG8_9GAMM|nr:HlyD family efflux transporter periplasmic adaptor subunit [Gilvimarinus sp. SDUM040014]MDO3380980.1 HlyD family efflux transporter periplasmic adaptor subunit [Gilvimarinus sp. SDUM040014]